MTVCHTCWEAAHAGCSRAKLVPLLLSLPSLSLFCPNGDLSGNSASFLPVLLLFSGLPLPCSPHSSTLPMVQEQRLEKGMAGWFYPTAVNLAVLNGSAVYSWLRHSLLPPLQDPGGFTVPATSQQSLGYCIFAADCCPASKVKTGRGPQCDPISSHSMDSLNSAPESAPCTTGLPHVLEYRAFLPREGCLQITVSLAGDQQNCDSSCGAMLDKHRLGLERSP